MAQENQDSKKRAAVGKMTGFIGVLCNLLLAGSKLVIGKLAASTSITADGLNNLSDAASSIVTLLGFKLAENIHTDMRDLNIWQVWLWLL